MANNVMDEIRAQRSEGGRLITQYCHDTAAELGFELRIITWAVDIIADYDRNILTIESSTGVTTEVTLSLEEIEDYPGEAGTAHTNAKLREAIRQIRE